MPSYIQECMRACAPEAYAALLICSRDLTTSSLAFQFAHEQAVATNAPVTLLCMKDKYQSNHPRSLRKSDGSDWGVGKYTPEGLSLLHMKYVDSIDDVFWYLVNVQMLAPDMRPFTLIVDGLDSMFKTREAIVDLTHLLALLKNTMDYLERVCSKNSSSNTNTDRSRCRALITIRNIEPNLIPIARRWLGLVLSAGVESDTGNWVLKHDHRYEARRDKPDEPIVFEVEDENVDMFDSGVGGSVQENSMMTVFVHKTLV